jgi:hypothetical protein
MASGTGGRGYRLAAMRRQWIAAATAVALIALAGCGGGTDRKINLQVGGSTRNVNATACGKTEPFQIYPKAPARIPYSGTVSPAPDGRWKVKVKLKRCAPGGDFQDVAGEQKIVGQPGGKFSGEFPIGEAGSYSIRAKFQGDNKPQSDKLYVKVG